MTRRAREVETLLLTMYAAAPLYFTYTIGVAPVLVFHAAMAAILVRVLRGHGPDLFPAPLMRALAVAYVPFYIVDAAMISRSAIAASTHLVLFIAVYQPSESMRSNNQAQRILTMSLIFIASLATSTHVTIILFVVSFAFFLFRQLMYVSHMETARSVGREYGEAPSLRAAGFYLAGATAIGALLFPMLPRVRNPFVQGITGSLPGSSTGLADSINFNEPRGGNDDPTIVARVWMGQQTIPFFAPIRLRGSVYDRFVKGEWRQTRGGIRELSARGSGFTLARPVGFQRPAIVQHRPVRGRLLLPSGTYRVSGLPNLYEGPARDSYFVFQNRGEMLTMNVEMAFKTEPLSIRRVPLSNYPVTPEVAALAQQMIGDAKDVETKASRIEQTMASRFTYLANPASLGHTMSIEQFLLKERRGHCEYFAAGMVALLTAVDVPARVVGGFYGGQLNPLTGYFTIRAQDAHAWVEAWNGAQWVVYDPTPPSLRPGATRGGILGLYAAAVSDSINYFWDRYVLTYGVGDQIAFAAELITRARDSFSAIRSGIGNGMREVASPRYLLTLGVVVMLGLAVVLVLRRRRPVFDLLAEHLKSMGIEVGPAMTMEEALAQLTPQQARALGPVIALYEEERFSAHANPARLRALKRKLAEL